MNISLKEFNPVSVDSNDLLVLEEIMRELDIDPHSKETTSEINDEKSRRKHILVVSSDDHRYRVVHGYVEWAYRKRDGEGMIAVYVLPKLNEIEKKSFVSIDLNHNLRARGLAIKTLLTSKTLDEFLVGITEDKLSRLLGSPSAKTLNAWKGISDMSESDFTKIASQTNDTRIQQALASVDNEPRSKMLQVLNEQQSHAKREPTLSMVSAYRSNPKISIDELRDKYGLVNVTFMDKDELSMMLDLDVKNCLDAISDKVDVGPMDLLNEWILEKGEKAGVFSTDVTENAPKMRSDEISE